jgi:tyrosinase
MRSYWDYSLDAEPQNIQSTRAFDSEIFSPDTGFGGNGLRVIPTAEQNRLNISGSTGGGCVKDGPFAPPNFMVNVPTPQCLKRDFVPWIINRFGDIALVDELLAQPDYTSVVWTFEKTRTLTLTGPANVHASGHFGVGGVLGTMGDATNSPGGMYSSHIYRRRSP